MTQAAAKRERVEQILGELAELGLMLARDLALDAKLDRQAAQDAREEAKDAEARAAEAALRESQIKRATEAANLGPERVTREENQKRRVRGVLNRLLWNEAEGDSEEYEVLLEDLDTRLYEAEDAPGFADMPIEVLTAKLAADMRLSGELVVTTAAAMTPTHTADPPLADTG